MRFTYTHYPNAADGFDYSFREDQCRDCIDVIEWCIIQYGLPDAARADGNKKWTAGSWSFMFAEEADALWFKMWFC